MTARIFSGSELVIASHNAGKVREIGELLEALQITVTSAGEKGLPEPEENGETFIENAIIKARASALGGGTPALADDSGLCVDVLGGAPGIFSARWAGPGKDFGVAMQRVMEATADYETCKAHFVCALALCWPDGHCETFEGYVHGQLTWPPRGEKGFGYDPMFVPRGHRHTFGEMNPEDKNAISHRTAAFRKLLEACFKTQ